MYYDSPQKIKQNSKIAIIEDIDYKLMKLFQLSILWRATISSLETFSKVNLGPHQEKLRKMILDSNPGKYTDYGCIQTFIYMEEKKLADALLMGVDLIRVEGYRILRFVFGGIMWNYFVSSHNENFKFKNMFLLENGTLTITKYPIDKIKYLFEIGIDLYKQGKLGAT